MWKLQDLEEEEYFNYRRNQIKKVASYLVPEANNTELSDAVVNQENKNSISLKY